jgi:hypothetical protein
MSKSDCPICMTSIPNIIFQICKSCYNQLCPNCALRLDTCPYCRATPFTTLQYTESNTITTPPSRSLKRFNKRLTSALRSSILYRAFNNCICRPNCLHKRCQCVFCNKRYLDRISDIVANELRHINTLIKNYNHNHICMIKIIDNELTATKIKQKMSCPLLPLFRCYNEYIIILRLNNNVQKQVKEYNQLLYAV